MSVAERPDPEAAPQKTAEAAQESIAAARPQTIERARQDIVAATAHPASEAAQREALSRLHGADAAAQQAAEPDPYAGLVTRAIALAIDGALIDAVALLVGVAVGLGVSLLHLPSEVDTALAAIGGGVWILWSVGYFVFFWSSTGQTMGSKIMHIRVVDRDGAGHLKPRRALYRFVWLCLAALPLLAGLLMMLWDDRRRCLQDRMARTLVVYVPASEVAAIAADGRPGDRRGLARAARQRPPQV